MTKGRTVYPTALAQHNIVTSVFIPEETQHTLSSLWCQSLYMGVLQGHYTLVSIERHWKLMQQFTLLKDVFQQVKIMICCLELHVYKLLPCHKFLPSSVTDNCWHSHLLITACTLSALFVYSTSAHLIIRWTILLFSSSSKYWEDPNLVPGLIHPITMLI